MYKFVFIGRSYDYNRFVENSIVESNENVFRCEPLSSRLHGFGYVLYRLHNSSRINRIVTLPFKNIWVKRVIAEEVRSKLKSDDKVCFIFSGGTAYLHMGVLDYFKSHYRNSKCVFCFTDLVESYKGNYPEFFPRFAGQFDLLVTYNEIDAENYTNILLAPPKVIDFSSVEEDFTIEPSDVFFAGRAKGRLSELFDIYDLCTDYGLKCDFRITNVPKKEQRHAPGIVYNEYMQYREVLKHSKRAKCILNVVQEGSAGITLRDYEAIGMNKLLMTNNPAIMKSAFYTPEKVIWTANLRHEIRKLRDSEQSIIWNGIEEYSLSKYLAWMEDALESN